MERIRICQLITELRPAGAERCVYELATRLDRGRFAVQVAALRGGAVADDLAAAGVPVTVLGVRGKLDVFKLGRLARFFRQERFDLVHTHLFHADLAGRLAARRARVPRLVHTVHIAEKRFRPWQYAWAALTANWCDRIVCVSQAVRDHHARRARLGLSRYQVIYNGIDADAYAASLGRRQELRRQWNVDESQVLAAYVGRLDRQKNIPLLLAACRQVHYQRANFKLVLAGDGPERALVEQFLAEPGNAVWARWMGFTRDVRGLLSAADMLLQPSRWEGFGLSAAEAMAAGLPVVGTMVEGLSEVVDTGATGILVTSDDLPALVAAVVGLVDDPGLRQRLGQAGVKRVRARFSLADNVCAHAKLYELLAGR